MRILLVEDDHMIGEVVEQELQEQHFAVDWVKDGNSATLAADTPHYEVVLLDLGLPQKHGFDVLRHLRGNGNHAGVLIMTAQDATEDKIKGATKELTVVIPAAAVALPMVPVPTVKPPSSVPSPT